MRLPSVGVVVHAIAGTRRLCCSGRRYRAMNRAELFGVTLANPISYILILSVMTVAPVSQIAPMREISTLVGAFIGGRLFAEEHLGRRLAGASIIMVGVLAVAHG